MARLTSFLSRQHDVIASFSFGVWSVRTCFFLKFSANSSILFYFYAIFLLKYLPGQKRGTCGHIMARFDGHLKCARCRDKGVGEDKCVLKKDCPICKSFTPEQEQQRATPTYRERKSKDKKMVLSSRGPFTRECWVKWRERRL